MKKYVTGLIALLLAVISTGFTISGNRSSDANPKSFSYNDYPDDTWMDDPNHYTLITGSLNCSGGSFRCGVVADDDGTGHPVLSGAVIFKKN